MDILSVIRRWALRDKLPLREISRRTGLSRNTIRRYLRAGIVEPKFKGPSRPSKLDPYAEKLSGWLLSEQRKSRALLHKRARDSPRESNVVAGRYEQTSEDDLQDHQLGAVG
ncbi:helix-turn-helix domain-containing protein [Ponticoccus gilvus]|nr:helix-turn-helix domain-containing protein [Enemella evansiae]